MAVTGTVVNQTATYYGPSTTLYTSGGSYAGPNETVTALWQEGSWYYIEYSTASGNKRMYIPTSAVSNLSGSVSTYTPTLQTRYVCISGYGTSTTTTYTGPGTTYRTAGTVSQHQTVYYLASKSYDDYSMIEYDISSTQKQRGWIWDNYIAPVKGVDTFAIIGTSAFAQAIYNAGYSYVSRYYVEKVEASLSQAEAQRICNAGLKLNVFFEIEYADNPASFTSASGESNATTAIMRATSAGQPSTTPIFFAVELNNDDLIIEENISKVKTYFTAIKEVFDDTIKNPNAYKVGVYSGVTICDALMPPIGQPRLAQQAFLADAWGGQNAYEAWAFKMTATIVPINNIDFTRSYGKTTSGSWQV